MEGFNRYLYLYRKENTGNYHCQHQYYTRNNTPDEIVNNTVVGGNIHKMEYGVAGRSRQYNGKTGRKHQTYAADGCQQPNGKLFRIFILVEDCIEYSAKSQNRYP